MKSEEDLSRVISELEYELIVDLTDGMSMAELIEFRESISNESI